MRTLSQLRAIVLPTALVVCGCTASFPDVQLDPYAVLPGKWGWEASDDCSASPEVIRFSTDKKQMHLAHAPINDNGVRDPRREVTYQVLRTLPNGLRMSMDGEERLDPSGKPVTWDLILLSQDQYCWHRGDWRPTGCTKPVLRCEI